MAPLAQSPIWLRRASARSNSTSLPPSPNAPTPSFSGPFDTVRLPRRSEASASRRLVGYMAASAPGFAKASADEDALLLFVPVAGKAPASVALAPVRRPRLARPKNDGGDNEGADNSGTSAPCWRVATSRRNTHQRTCRFAPAGAAIGQLLAARGCASRRRATVAASADR
jgi:hypothetical protein